MNSKQLYRVTEAMALLSLGGHPGELPDGRRVPHHRAARSTQAPGPAGRLRRPLATRRSAEGQHPHPAPDALDPEPGRPARDGPGQDQTQPRDAVRRPHGAGVPAVQVADLRPGGGASCRSGRFPLHAYIVLSLLIGARTEELRALHWHEVDLDGRPDADPPVLPSIAVYRSVRVGGDTKTAKSRRRLALPTRCVDALRRHRDRHQTREHPAVRISCSPRPTGPTPTTCVARPPRHRGSRSRTGRVDTARAAAQLRVTALRVGRPDRGHLAAGRAQRDRRHRAGVPPPAPRHPRRRGATAMNDIFPLDDAG